MILQSLTLRWLHIENLYYLLNSMLSRTLGVMFKVKQLFTKKYLPVLLLRITLFFVHFNSFMVTPFQSVEVSKSYQNRQVTSIKFKKLI